MATLDRTEFLRRYPTGSYEGYVAGEEAATRYRTMGAAALNASLAAEAADNKALGFSND